MTIENIKEKVANVAEQYPVKQVLLFGSRADGTNNEDSDVDLIMEFYEPVTLIALSSIRIQLEELLELEVDVVHGPLRETDLLEIGKVIELYAA